jgi:hypothetical protein
MGAVLIDTLIEYDEPAQAWHNELNLCDPAPARCGIRTMRSGRIRRVYDGRSLSSAAETLERRLLCEIT